MTFYTIILSKLQR